MSKHRGGFFQTPPRLCDQASHLKLGDVWPALCIQGSGGGESLMESGVWVTLDTQREMVNVCLEEVPSH